MSSNNTSALDENEVFEYTGNSQTVPDDVVRVRFHASVVEVEEKAFYECSKLKKVVFNKGLQNVGEGAFCGCINLVEVVFNDQLHTIGQRAFYGTALECIRLPKYLREIGNLAFYNCKRLRDIGDHSPHNNVKKVRIHAFDNCPSLQKLRLPEIVNRLGEIVQYQPEVVSKVDAVLDKKVKRKKKRTRGVRLGNELWDLRIVLPIEQINDPHGQQCETTGCQLAACCIWSGSADPTIPWYYCLDCQEKDFNGWPTEKRDIPLRVMSNELRNVMIEKSTKWTKYPAPFPNLPTGGEDEAVVPSEVSDSSVERRGGEIFISSSLVDMGRSKYWTSNKRWQLRQISKSIAYYEMKEGLTLFELALWKAKIEQAGSTSPANRNACRIEVPGPVKDTILQYLSS